MKKITLFSLIFCLFTAKAFASHIDEIVQNLGEVNSLSIEVGPIVELENETLFNIHQHVSGPVYKLEQYYRPDLDGIQKMFFQKKSHYPDFCNEFSRRKNIKKCYKNFSKVLKKTNIENAYYVTGSNDSNNFKYLFLNLKENNRSLNIKFIIQDER